MVVARIDPTYDAWHAQARALLAGNVPPAEVLWTTTGEGQPLLGDLAPPAPARQAPGVRVPRAFVEAASLAARHTSAGRWALLYRVLWRLVHEGRDLLANELDDDVLELRRLVRSVKEDVERAKAFIRFRAIGPPGAERFIAWHIPDHDVAELVAPHFAKRYPNMLWSIFTPAASVHWDGEGIRRDRGVDATALPAEDSDRAAVALWRTYYAAAFNPARVNETKLGRDLPKRFRATLPEGPEIPDLIAGAANRTRALRHASSEATARVLVPPSKDLRVLREAASACTGCDLYRHATQAVFGEGPPAASIVLVGEQPGDQEDLAGRPFVGPAGELLDRALEAAGIERDDVYVTNAVKHFAWEPRGKRRIHRTPRLSEVRACRPWVEAELAAIAPRTVVCLGATAAQSLLGPQARVSALRGRVLTGYAWAPSVVVTLHPAAVLRADGVDAQQSAFGSLVSDLSLARESKPGSA